MRLISLVLLVCSVWGCAGSPSRAEQPRSIMIVGVDADLQSVSRNDRIFGAVEVAMAEPLAAAGYEVLTEDQVIPGRGPASDIRRSGDRTLALVRSVDEPSARFAALCTLYANSRREANQTRLRLRLGVDLVDLADGAVSDFELTGSDDWFVPDSCTGDCLQRAFTVRAQELAYSAGALVSEQAARRGTRVAENRYTGSDVRLARQVELRFVGFTQAEIFRLEDQLQAFDEFRSIRLVYSSTHRVTYSYVTGLTVPRLHRRLAEELEAQGLDADISPEHDRLDIHRAAAPRARRRGGEPE
ncbi:MAG: hypothetical protein AAFX44_18440 [Pseudomonadota bacterium]